MASKIVCQASQTFDVLPVQKRAFRKTETENQALMSGENRLQILEFAALNVPEVQQRHLREKEPQSEVLRSAIR